jgi:hypothetical protein
MRSATSDCSVWPCCVQSGPAQDDDADRDPDPTAAIETLGGRSSRRPRSPRLPAALHGAGGLALLGPAVGAAALVAEARSVGNPSS